MIINQKYISSNLIKNKEQKIILIRSQQGTGKSTMFRKFIQETNYNFIFIGSRISLIVDQRTKFNKYNKNINTKLYNNNKNILEQDDNIFICINSLMNLENFNFSNYIIFIDEIQATIETLLFSSTIKNCKKVKIFNLLIKILNNCRLFIGVEAEISPNFIEFIKAYKEKNNKVLVIDNFFKSYKDIKINIIHNTNIIYKKIKKIKKFIIATDTRNKAISLHKKLNKQNNIKLIVGNKNSFTKTKNEIDETKIYDLDQYNKVIFSPKITQGVDSNIKRSVFCYLSGFSINHKAMVQQITRCRNIDEVYISFNSLKNNDDIYNFIEKINYNNQRIKQEVLKIFEEEYKDIDKYNKFKHHYINLFNEYFECPRIKKQKLIKLLQFKGFKIVY